MNVPEEETIAELLKRGLEQPTELQVRFWVDINH
jgi:hypothetical protein